jgi:hypothetical protein
MPFPQSQGHPGPVPMGWRSESPSGRIDRLGSAVGSCYARHFHPDPHGKRRSAGPDALRRGHPPGHGLEPWAAPNLGASPHQTCPHQTCLYQRSCPNPQRRRVELAPLLGPGSAGLSSPSGSDSMVYGSFGRGTGNCPAAGASKLKPDSGGWGWLATRNQTGVVGAIKPGFPTAGALSHPLLRAADQVQVLDRRRRCLWQGPGRDFDPNQDFPRLFEGASIPGHDQVRDKPNP